MIEKPLVSVCVQTYQHVNFISECLEGILMQKTSFPFEVIIGEDESTDGTREICMQYAEKYPDKIRLFLRSRKDVVFINGQPTGRFNFIANLKAARGKYIALCEGDDYWTDPHKLQKQVDFLESEPDFVMCFTNGRIVDEESNLIAEKQLTGIRPNIYSSKDVPFFAPTHTRLFKNIPIDKAPATLMSTRGADLYHAAWLTHFGKIMFLDFVSSSYRLHQGGIISSKERFYQDMFSLETGLSMLKLDNNQQNSSKLVSFILKHLKDAGENVTSTLKAKEFTIVFITAAMNLNKKNLLPLLALFLRSLTITLGRPFYRYLKQNLWLPRKNSCLVIKLRKWMYLS